MNLSGMKLQWDGIEKGPKLELDFKLEKFNFDFDFDFDCN